MLTQTVERFYSELAEVLIIKNSRQAAKITEIAVANLMMVCAAKGQAESDSVELQQHIPVHNNLDEAVDALVESLILIQAGPE